ncbi:hypothetical protein MRB56_09085 [Halomonas cupida]|uniref:hypothetical protein n=1 Tax=Halomonas cupida TaxID=44933 RepID=UPI0039B5AB67
MADQVQICNMALANIGSYVPIQSLSEHSKEARACALYYDHCLDILLREFEWNFAKRSIELASLGEPPEGWMYRYQYPTDALYVVRLGQFALKNCKDDLSRLKNMFMIVGTDSGKAILSNTDDASCVYIAKPENPNVMGPMFVDALAWSISSRIAPGITGDRQTTIDASGMYNLMLNKAIARDLSESSEPPKQEAETVQVRGVTTERRWDGQ